MHKLNEQINDIAVDQLELSLNIEFHSLWAVNMQQSTVICNAPSGNFEEKYFNFRKLHLENEWDFANKWQENIY